MEYILVLVIWLLEGKYKKHKVITSNWDLSYRVRTCLSRYSSSVRVVFYFKDMEKFASDATFNDKWHENPGRSRTVGYDENLTKLESYSEKNPNAPIKRAAQSLKPCRESLKTILHTFWIFIHTKFQCINYSLKSRCTIECNFARKLWNSLNLKKASSWTGKNHIIRNFSFVPNYAIWDTISTKHIVHLKKIINN